MTISAILSAIGIAPKNLPQASETLATAKSTLEQVSAMFAAANLNLDQMLAGGLDSLRAHIASVDNSAEVTTLTDKVTTLTAAATAAATTIAAQSKAIEGHNATISTAKALLVSVGFTNDIATAKAEDVKAAFADHTKKAAALELQKAGHAPVATIDPNAIDTKTMTRAAFSALSPGAKSRFSLAGGKLTD